ncbi:FACT complex subunit SSRP1, partial [Striga asiatica]
SGKKDNSLIEDSERHHRELLVYWYGLIHNFSNVRSLEAIGTATIPVLITLLSLIVPVLAKVSWCFLSCMDRGRMNEEPSEFHLAGDILTTNDISKLGAELAALKNLGQLKVRSGGIVWKKQGGGKAVEVDKSDLMGLTWMKVPRSNQLGVRTKDGLRYKFTGFRDQDVASLSTFFQSNFGKTPEEKQLSVSGKNWGEVDLNGNTLTFLVGGKQAFEVSLADVAQTQLQGKNDVTLEFHVDDTTGANEKDSLMEICFHIPNSNTQFVGDENHPSAQVFKEEIVSVADVGAGGEKAVFTFDGIAILTPRGRYSVGLHLSFLHFQGQANDFKIKYNSVVRVFWLPKSNQPHTFVIVTLDHQLGKFETNAVIDTTLSMSDELYNTRYKDKLQPEHKGLIHEIFITSLRGLSGAKVTKPGKFRSSQDGYAMISSLKAEDGVLYPLEKSFFFLPKPPTLILHEEVQYIKGV